MFYRIEAVSNTSKNDGLEGYYDRLKVSGFEVVTMNLTSDMKCSLIRIESLRDINKLTKTVGKILIEEDRIFIYDGYFK